MKTKILLTITGVIFSITLYGQARIIDRKMRIFKTDENIDINGEIGYLEVPENRKDTLSRLIKFKYVRLKSLSKNPTAPLVFIEGGGGSSTWQAENPAVLKDWIELLDLGDLIFVDRRGNNDEALTYIYTEELPEDFFVSEHEAYAHYEKMIKSSLIIFDERNVDVTGYNIEEYAWDINQLMGALEIERYSIFGFSFGSHIGMTMIKLFPEQIEKAIFAGADAPDQAFNYPRYLDNQIDKLAGMIREDEKLSQSIPDFKALLHRVMKKLEKKPAVVVIKNPVTGKKIHLKVGSFGLSLILRLDIDDYNDIPAIPRLLYSIDQGDYTILKWFLQKRVVFALAVSGNGLNQQLASGVDESRWDLIEKEAKASVFGNIVNFPFSAAKDHWVSNKLSFDPSIPIVTNIPTLFITGELDCRTPAEQVTETMKGFNNALHVEVKNAGHEQAMWERETFDKIIPMFLKGESVEKVETNYSDLTFIKLKGKTKRHPSLR
ncbi:hypothetical protein GCM10011506_22900 [Marivirga lumbricoides]|uniref:AB hydrolase-1 domain-containing protein n=1 Tax=Marivirga lumbricoides TaxID=1046115 RepID=A0ABQ1M9I5_9BACT|nr:hypothetical protein GCM10011506_22900 [Marivirga lumbricoides]